MGARATDAHEAWAAVADALDVALAMLPGVGAAPDAEVAAVLDAVAVVARLADAGLVGVARVVTARSDEVDAEHSFARQCGEPSARRLLAARTGLRAGQVRRLQSLAAATTSQVSLTGASIEAGFPLVGAALTAGALSLDQADAIVTNLAQAAPRCHPDALLLAERDLVAGATGRAARAADDDATGDDADADAAPWTAEDTASQARRARDLLDQDGLEPRYDERAAERFLRAATRADGMVAGSFLLPELPGAALLMALAAHGKPGTRPRFRTAEETAADDAEAEERPAIDPRSPAQRGADVLASLIERGLEVADMPRIGGAAPTVVVTVTKDALDAHAAGETATQDGRPVAARVDHTGDEVPASVAEQLVCDAQVQVLFADHVGHPLHLGRSSRLFSNAIRRAATARDGGCVGCGAPPGFCQVHHLVWWVHGGRTDIDNALTVCSWCHHEIHRGRLHPARDARGRWRLVATIPSKSHYRPAA